MQIQSYVALAEWEDGKIVREAKALVPSAIVWAKQGDRAPEIFYQAAIDRAVRCRDPFVQLRGHWIVRRLAPHRTEFPPRESRGGPVAVCDGKQRIFILAADSPSRRFNRT